MCVCLLLVSCRSGLQCLELQLWLHCNISQKNQLVWCSTTQKKKNDWRLAAATSGWKNTWFALIIHLRGLNQSQKCCSNVTWPLQLKVDAMRNVILRHSSIDSEFTVKQSKTCRAWVTVWPTANASGGGKKNRILLSHSMHTGKIHTKNLKLIFYLNNHFLEPLSSEQGFLWGGGGRNVYFFPA